MKVLNIPISLTINSHTLANLKEIFSKSVFDSMVPGDFRIYQEGNSHLVLLRMAPAAVPQTVSLNENSNTMFIKSSDNTKLAIQLPENCKYVKKDITCKFHLDFLTAKISLAV